MENKSAKKTENMEADIDSHGLRKRIRGPKRLCVEAHLLKWHRVWGYVCFKAYPEIMLLNVQASAASHLRKTQLPFHVPSPFHYSLTLEIPV